MLLCRWMSWAATEDCLQNTSAEGRSLLAPDGYAAFNAKKHRLFDVFSSRHAANGGYRVAGDVVTRRQLYELLSCFRVDAGTLPSEVRPDRYEYYVAVRLIEWIRLVRPCFTIGAVWPPF